MHIYNRHRAGVSDDYFFDTFFINFCYVIFAIYHMNESNKNKHNTINKGYFRVIISASRLIYLGAKGYFNDMTV